MDPAILVNGFIIRLVKTIRKTSLTSFPLSHSQTARNKQIPSSKICSRWLCALLCVLGQPYLQSIFEIYLPSFSVLWPSTKPPSLPPCTTPEPPPPEALPSPALLLWSNALWLQCEIPAPHHSALRTQSSWRQGVVSIDFPISQKCLLKYLKPKWISENVSKYFWFSVST